MGKNKIQPKDERQLPEGMQAKGQANTTMINGKECFLPSGFGSYVPNPWGALPISEYTGQTYDPRWAVQLVSTKRKNERERE